MTLRGAISGFGQVAARAHVAGWSTRPSVNIVAVHDPLAERRREALALIKNVRVYDNLELMLDGERLDFLDVASPPAFHVAAATTALEAGMSVIVEKPLCLNPGEFDRLAAAAARASRVLMCVHNWKHSPAYRRAHEMVSSGRLGKLRYLQLLRLRSEPAGGRSSVGQSTADADGEKKWRLDHTVGGGILVDHGWHAFYLMQWLFGGDAPEGVSAYLDSQPGAAVEDLADLRVSFPAGRLAYAHLSWRASVRRTSAMLYGEEAVLEIEGNRAVLTDRFGKAQDLSVTDARDDSYHATWFSGIAEQFERAVTAGPDSPIVRENQAEARAAVALVLDARKSDREGNAQVKVAP
jgi:predicted dehydrogenase